jgi:hypothetical protein
LHNRLRRGPRAGGAREDRPAPPAKLGSFCAFAPRPLPLWPRTTRRRRELGSFCTVLRRRGPAPLVGWAVPTIFPGGKLGSFCAFCLRRAPARRNWVRFARFTPRGEPRLARRPPLPTYPSPPKFGFVLHNFHRQPHPAGRNWVRFARFLLSIAAGREKLGSFCAFDLRRPRPAGVFQPQSPIRGGGAPGPSCLTLDTSNLKLSRREILESPFHSWDWCNSLWMTISDRRHPRRPHFYK